MKLNNAALSKSIPGLVEMRQCNRTTCSNSFIRGNVFYRHTCSNFIKLFKNRSDMTYCHNCDNLIKSNVKILFCRTTYLGFWSLIYWTVSFLRWEKGHWLNIYIFYCNIYPMIFLLRETINIPQAVKRHSFFPRQCEDLSALGHLLSPICRKPVSGHSVTENVSKSDQDIFVRPLSNFTLLVIPIKGKGNKFMSLCSHCEQLYKCQVLMHRLHPMTIPERFLQRWGTT